MGDRTWVTVNIHESSLSKNNLTTEDLPRKPCNEYSSDGILELGFGEVNYGIDDDLINFLCEKKIEFNYYWESGGDYSAGHRIYRYNSEGESIYDEFYDEEQATFNLLKTLKEMSDKDMRAYVEKVYNNMKQFELNEKLEDIIKKANRENFIKNCTD